jgi:hypothetical protein
MFLQGDLQVMQFKFNLLEGYSNSDPFVPKSLEFRLYLHQLEYPCLMAAALGILQAVSLMIDPELLGARGNEWLAN